MLLGFAAFLLLAVRWIIFPNSAFEDDATVHSSLGARVVVQNQVPRRVMRGGDSEESARSSLPRNAGGTALLLHGKTDLAVQKLRAESRRGNAVALSDLSAALVTKSELDIGVLAGNLATVEAIAAARQAIASMPKLAAAHFNLALALERAGLIPEARAEFEAAERLETNRRWRAEAHDRAAWLRENVPFAIQDFVESYVEATGNRPFRQVLSPYLDERDRNRDLSRTNGDDAIARLRRASEIYKSGVIGGDSDIQALTARLLARVATDFSPREEVDPYAQRYFIAARLDEEGRDEEAFALLRSLDGDVLAAKRRAGWVAQLACEEGMLEIVRNNAPKALDLFEREFDRNVIAGDQKLALMFDDLTRDVRAHLMKAAFKRRDSAAAFTLSGVRATLAEIHVALAADAAIVQFTSLHDQVIVFVIQSEAFAIVTLGATADTVARAADAMRHAEGSEFAQAAATLHDLVFAPVSDHLKGVSTLAIVPHRELMGIPFGALLDVNRGQHLFERFSIVHAATAEAAIASSRRAKESHDATLLAIAATEFDQERYSDAGALTAADREASAITARSRCGRLLTGSDATPAAVQREIADNAVIHYAGHIVRRGADVQLLLSPSKGRNTLSAKEIGRLRLDNSRVVVLAACRGASAGELHTIVPNMAEAFLAAGVPTVIASSYQVDDAAAPATMLRLHRFLRDGDDAADALRKTALEELKSGRAGPLSLRFLAIGGTSSLLR